MTFGGFSKLVFGDERTGKEGTTQVESTSEGTATAWNRTDKVSFIATATSAGELGSRSGDLLLLYLKNGRQTRYT